MLPPPVLVEPDDRKLLRQSVADFVADAGEPSKVRARRESDIGYDRAIWREMAGLGWLQLAIPEIQGGLGMSFADLAALHEEYGKAAMPEPLIAVGVLAAGALSGGENDALREAELPALLSGERTATLAWQSGVHALTSDHVAIEAATDGNGYRISGTAEFVHAAAGADAFIVAARHKDGVILAWVKACDASIETLRNADYAPLGMVTFDNARGVPIAGPETGAALLDRLLDKGRVAVCAEAVGVMHQTLVTTLDYMRTREQFGRAIGSFQALQHRAVNLYIQLELSRSVVMKAAAAIDAGLPEIPRLAAQCKARCAEASVQVAGQSVHLHGTIGFTEELDLSILIRRGHALSAWLGNGDANLRRYTHLRWPEGIAA
jgi:alkylation response protein AidB-like acyl-CoA dehydrogenase